MEAQSHGRAALSLAALGVVYGDIGTSPLYALKETLNPGHGIASGPETVLGAASAIFWALVLQCCWRSPAPRRCTPTWGISAVRRSGWPWYGLVFPALVLNYLGQGALLSRTPAAVSNPFFLLYPAWALYPMVLLAT